MGYMGKEVFVVMEENTKSLVIVVWKPMILDSKVDRFKYETNSQFARPWYGQFTTERKRSRYRNTDRIVVAFDVLKSE
jgi:uncharacterized membrane protein